MFVSLLALSVAALADAPKSEKLPGNNLQGLFLGDDYPAVALDRNEEGAVGVIVSIGADGRVEDCVVESSSGSAALDVETCRVIWKRAKFKPGPSHTLHQTIR